MGIFKHYASYYNLLYQDKNYREEAEFVHGLIRKYNPAASSLFEIGCGTGNHAIQLAEKEYTIHGIDTSEIMLEEGHKRISSLPSAITTRISIESGDARTYRSDQRYDSVISLFHVMSYQTSNSDLANAFETARRLLRPGGLFIFDYWYGPAVLTEKPQTTVKRMSDNRINVIRIAEPVLRPNANLVDVNFQIIVEDKSTNAFELLQERHTMRYIFKSELEALFSQIGFEELEFAEWMTGNTPGVSTWSVYSVGRFNG